MIDIIKAHKFSFKNREAILKSRKCGCFYCLNIFSKDEIEFWVDEDKNGVGQTAICPKCQIDSVLGDFGVKFDKEFLEKMNKHWFLNGKIKQMNIKSFILGTTNVFSFKIPRWLIAILIWVTYGSFDFLGRTVLTLVVMLLWYGWNKRKDAKNKK